ncbi:MAG: hypothetical protein ABIN94_11680 [Ferruginibacter sp.]
MRNEIFSEQPSSLTSKNETGISRFFSSPVALIRLSAILFVGVTIGHMSGYPWTSAQNPQESQLVSSMKSVNYIFAGESSSYWNLYFGWGLWVVVLLLTLAIILWLLSGLVRLAPQRIGVITGIISATCLAGAYFSFRFFYIPPFIMFSVMFIILLAATAQLLKKRY